MPDYTGTDANKIAHYMLRWVNTRGEKGSWSETASAGLGAWRETSRGMSDSR